MATLETLRESLRLDLKDPSVVRWTDALLERHIEHALVEFSEAIPVEVKATVATVAASREVDISDLHPRVVIQAVEYPVDQWPPEYVRFSLWGDILTLDLNYAPDGSNCHIYYGRPHTAPDDSDWTGTTAYVLGDYVAPTTQNGYRYECTTAGTSGGGEPAWPMTVGDTVNDNTAVWTCRQSTFSPLYDELIILGAGGFALVEWTQHAINSVNVGGQATAREFQSEGTRRLDQFRRELRRLGIVNRVRIRQLYTPANPIVSRFKVSGP